MNYVRRMILQKSKDTSIKNYLQLQNENLSFIYVMFLERRLKIILNISLNIQNKT